MQIYNFRRRRLLPIYHRENDFACQFDTITPDERDIIIHAKRSLMHTHESTWGKTRKKDLFDATMGSWNGAETCELVGNYILSIIEAKHGNNIGLYLEMMG